MNISIVIPIVLGWLAALLVNYISDVLPATRKLTTPTCQQCTVKTTLTDYLLLKTCSACGIARSWRTWLVQFFGVAASLYIWFVPPKGLGYWLSFILLIYLAVVFVIDVEHRLILHPVSYVGIAVGLLIGIILHGIQSTLIGGAVGFGVMYLLYIMGVLFARRLARRQGETAIEEGDALGFGDVNLAGIVGLMLGWPLISFGILAAILAGGVVSLLLIVGMLLLKRYQAFAAIPYAPFLILGVVLLIFR